MICRLDRTLDKLDRVWYRGVLLHWSTCRCWQGETPRLSWSDGVSERVGECSGQLSSARGQYIHKVPKGVCHERVSFTTVQRSSAFSIRLVPVNGTCEGLCTYWCRSIGFRPCGAFLPFLMLGRLWRNGCQTANDLFQKKMGFQESRKAVSTGRGSSFKRWCWPASFKCWPVI